MDRLRSCRAGRGGLAGLASRLVLLSIISVISIVAAAAGSGGALLAARPLAVEDLAQPWRWRRFDRDGRLSSGVVTALGHDRDDMVYAGTPDGLFRYNGYRWIKIAGAAPLGGQPLTRVFENRREIFVATPRDIWVLRLGVELHRVHESSSFLIASSPAGGAFIIDLATRSHLRLEDGGAVPLESGAQAAPLPRGELADYVADSTGTHWIASSAGLFRRQVGRQRAWRLASGLGARLEGLPCERLFLVRYQTIRRRPDSYLVDVSRPRFRLWARFRGAGGEPILARRKLDGSWTAVDIAPGGETGPAAAPRIEELLRDGSGNFYALTADGSLLFSPDGDTWSAAGALGIGRARLRSGLLDLHGYVWFVFELSDRRGGVARFDPESRRWEQLAAIGGDGAASPGDDGDDGDDGGLRHTTASSVLEASDGSVWIGSETALYRYRDGRVEIYRSTGDAALAHDARRAAARPGRGGSSSTRFDGVYYLETGRWYRHEDAALALGGQPIRRIVTDRKGRLWFLPRSGPKVYRYRVTVDRLDEFDLGHGDVSDLVEASDGVFRAATQQGLIEMTVEGASASIRRVLDSSSGLRYSSIFAVTENPVDGSIWICYHLAGVARIEGDTIEHFDAPQGPLSPKVWALLATPSVMGWNLWFGTDRGISRFDGECWYHYSVAGLDPQESQVLSLCASRTEEGSILAGTFANGVFRFRKDDFRRPKFVATDFARRVPGTDGLLFSWEARDMKDATPPEDLLYRYRLDGGAWSPFSNRTEVVLSGLAPGPHTFEVQVRDLDGNSNRIPVYSRFEVGTSRWRLGDLDRWQIAAICAAIVLAAALLIAARRTLDPAARYRALAAALDVPLLLIDRDGRIVDFNGVRPEILGIETLGARRLAGLPVILMPVLHGERARDAVDKALAGEAAMCFEEVPEAEDAAEASSPRPRRVVALHAIPLRRTRGGAVLGAALIATDESALAGARARDERQLRMSAVRELAENLSSRLGEIAAGLEREVARLEEGPGPGRHAAGALKEHAAAVEELTRALEIFARPRPPERRETVSPLDLLEEALGPSGNGMHPFPEHVRFDVRAQTGLWRVAVDAGSVTRAFEEVIRNAADAMPRGGDVKIRLENRSLDEGRGEDARPVRRGRFVEVSVADSGPGLDPNQRLQVFDPLFSTKPRRRHRGMGLSLAYGIVRGHGGDIRIETPPEGGTRVTILLPAAD